MNPILGTIYGTGGMEKQASPYTGRALTLDDLSMSVAQEHLGSGASLEKVAAAASPLSERLSEADLQGRILAHNEFVMMEKAAHDGNPEALGAFFADESSNDPVRGAILQELARREQSRG